MPLMEIRELSHIYSWGTPFENTALDKVSFSLEPDCTVGLIGHTGSGKSTLIQHLNALLKPTSGTVFLAGSDIFSSKSVMRDTRFRVGLVFQYPEYQLFEETVEADIAFGPKNQGLSGDGLRHRVWEALSFVGLPETLLSESPLELSGGQKRRVAIAGVLAMKPEILILDEPSAGLDPAAREDLMKNLLNWRKVSGSTILLVTHDMNAAALCDRLLVMEHGHMVADGTPAEVFSESDRLQALGLDLPECAKIAGMLRKKGLDIPASIYTVEGLRDAVLSLWSKEGKSC